jgi:hypothetical protein
MAQAEELGMRPVVARCHLSLGALYQGAGHLPQARSELSTAIDLFRAMGMTFWQAQAEAKLVKA